MKELMGGLWFAGLAAGALLGIVPVLILGALGTLTGAAAIWQEKLNERAANSWRAEYPKYRY